ncbi:MAG: phosphoglycerate kinase [Actinomycetota bacterium]
MKLRSLDDLDVAGKRVLVRVDFNVPLKDGRVTDDLRIRSAIPTLEALMDRGATVICCSHLGRPKGKPDPQYSLKPVAAVLQGLTGKTVRLTSGPAGPPGELEDLKPDEIGLLENLRFDPGEEANEDGFASELAALADAYVNDAFGAVHRAHASTAAVAEKLPAAAGLLLHKEVEALSGVLEEPRRPFVVVLGGAKVSDKLGVVRNVMTKADTIIIGGAMANTFLAAQGAEVGNSRIEQDRLDEVRSTLDVARNDAVELMLPEDLVVAEAFEETAEGRVTEAHRVPAGMMALDVGPATQERYAEKIERAGTVLWNGPMGVFEWDNFSHGTKAVARAVAETGAFTVVGGGDSAAALAAFGLTEKVDHLSTGGGASLELLEGKQLPGLTPLQI